MRLSASTQQEMKESKKGRKKWGRDWSFDWRRDPSKQKEGTAFSVTAWENLEKGSLNKRKLNCQRIGNS